jgi:hypothetical protein
MKSMFNKIVKLRMGKSDYKKVITFTYFSKFVPSIHFKFNFEVNLLKLTLINIRSWSVWRLKGHLCPPTNFLYLHYYVSILLNTNDEIYIFIWRNRNAKRILFDANIFYVFLPKNFDNQSMICKQMQSN